MVPAPYRRRRYSIAAGTAWVMLAALAACATPSERIDRLAGAAGFEKQVVVGDPFEHLVYIKDGDQRASSFHVYIEGDGSPWFTRYRVASDPTPRQPLVLKLMRQDPGPALYLGRPCYFGLMKHCQPEHWTGGRYSATVVDSMAVALRTIRDRLGWQGTPTLIGHSGGGALVMLLAPRIADTKAILTVAGNLDIDAWTRLHEYTPLTGSLNPAEADPLPARIRQLHVTGGHDRNVPPSITRAGLVRQRNAELAHFPEQAHHCCWEASWPAILERL